VGLTSPNFRIGLESPTFRSLGAAPACGSCNASKCNEEVTCWLRRKRLDERVFLLRHLEINATLALRFGATTQKSPVPD
jgi:hypothetical protein